MAIFNSYFDITRGYFLITTIIFPEKLPGPSSVAASSKVWAAAGAAALRAAGNSNPWLRCRWEVAGRWGNLWNM
jgi:hypothetical protein